MRVGSVGPRTFSSSLLAFHPHSPHPVPRPHQAYDQAAQLSSRLIKDNVATWERWVYLFAQTRQDQ